MGSRSKRHCYRHGKELAGDGSGTIVAAVTWGYTAPEKLRSLAPTLMLERMEEIAERLVG
jgi:hypothetical protein